MASADNADLVRGRMRSQRVVTPRCASPADVVGWMGAVQAQDYRAALWGIALRTDAATEADVERAVASRAILRTWPMRGTLHYVPAADARWMLELLAPRVIRRAAGRYRQLGLDDRTFARARALLEAALAGDRQLTRTEVMEALRRGRVSPAGQRGPHIIGYLAMRGVLCISAHRGKQPTVALLDEWAPASRATRLEPDEALAELARRYFRSHGPASARDFAWWTGLNLGEARRAIQLAGEPPPPARGRMVTPTIHLLPVYDEYTVAYRDRDAFLDPAHAERAKRAIFTPVVAVDGRVAGTWRRAIASARVTVKTSLFAPPSAAVRAALTAAVTRYGEFLGLPVAHRS